MLFASKDCPIAIGLGTSLQRHLTATLNAVIVNHAPFPAWTNLARARTLPGVRFADFCRRQDVWRRGAR